jgi:3-oxoadipate enol-lactonase
MTAMITTSIGRLNVRTRRGDPDRTPLVLGHGIFLDSSVWDEVLAGQPTDRTVITIDGPGHGASDPPPRGWTLAQHATALVEVLDTLGVQRVVLAGHSWGGMVSLRAALYAPDRVAGVGLVNTPLMRTGGPARLGFHVQQLLLRTTGPSPFFARRAAAALHDARSLARRPELVQRTVARMSGHRGAALADAVRAVVLDPPDMVDQVGRLTVPTSVIAGKHDYVLPPALRATLHATAPDADITIVSGGHISPEEDPAGVARALRDLLARTESPTARWKGI